jgi:hypothetical protein
MKNYKTITLLPEFYLVLENAVVKHWWLMPIILATWEAEIWKIR